jgi:hypothetical protein
MQTDLMNRIVATLVGAILGALVTLFLAWRKIKGENRLAAATFLDGVAAALSGIGASFEAGKIPHEHGHRLLGLIPYFRTNVRPHLPQQSHELLKRICTVAERATQIDSDLYENLEPDPKKRADLIMDIKRLVGDLLAAADRLRGGQRLI